jgi:hypothetical protein
VTPLSVPVTEPRPVLDPVLEPLLLLPSLLKPVLAGALLPNVPDVLATPGAAPAALPRAGMAPETEFRPGRLLLARAAGLHRAVGLDHVAAGRRRRRGRGTAGRADDVSRGREARYGQGQAAENPAGRVEPAQRDRGVLRLRERGRGDAHRQDGRRGGTPSKIRQLYTKHSISMW